MSEEIVNRVEKSKLVTIDLEDFYSNGERILLDIKDWLYAEQILKEKDFRLFVKNHNWEAYRDKYIAITCSTEAIIPSWAYLLITVKAAPFAKKIIVGDLSQLEISIFQEIIEAIPIDIYKNKPIIIKGCSKINIPQTSYTLLVTRLLPIANSIMYGEACSSVPLYKRNIK